MAFDLHAPRENDRYFNKRKVAHSSRTYVEHYDYYDYYYDYGVLLPPPKG